MAGVIKVQDMESAVTRAAAERGGRRGLHTCGEKILGTSLLLSRRRKDWWCFLFEYGAKILGPDSLSCR